MLQINVLVDALVQALKAQGRFSSVLRSNLRQDGSEHALQAHSYPALSPCLFRSESQPKPHKKHQQRG
jgi:hypothetical protein